MQWQLVLTGVGIGFAFSAPVGPVNLLCVRKTVAAGFRAGLFTGLGAVAADTIYAAMAVFGVAAVLGVLQEHARLAQAVGGVFVIGFGVTALFQTRRQALAVEKPMERYRGLFGGFVLTLANPGVLFGYVLVASGLSEALIEAQDFRNPVMLLVGIVLGATLWWLGLAFVVSRVRHRLDQRWFGLVNRIAGGVLILFGVGLFVRALLGFV